MITMVSRMTMMVITVMTTKTKTLTGTICHRLNPRDQQGKQQQKQDSQKVTN